jgi:putative glutamine amidotransferase
MRKPIIGIILDLAEDSEKYSYAKKPWYALRSCYSDCISKYGGTPVMIPYHQDIESVAELVDGLLVPGGDEDINPKFYGQEISSKRVKTNDVRAQFELDLTANIIEKKKSFFGICNGIQLLNVALGGTLIQHIPDSVKSDINHEQPVPKDAPSHPVCIDKNSYLSTLSDSEEILVNSTHHQSIDKLGSELIISARAPDGIIEAIEMRGHPFAIGVQWHSEYMNTKLDENLFKEFIKSC